MRGFSLIEAMASLAVSGIAGAATVGAFAAAVRDRGDGGREWQALSIAEQQMEHLASVPRTSADLADTVDDAAAPGSVADRTCSSGVDGRKSDDLRVDAFGTPQRDGPFKLCWKNTAGHPRGLLINTRVYVSFSTKSGERTVMLQTWR